MFEHDESQRLQREIENLKARKKLLSGGRTNESLLLQLERDLAVIESVLGQKLAKNP
jgi:hypothetical protein